jgi:predicted Holliday junction resolvase-like endonuclease
MVAFFALVFALVLQTIRVERLAASLKERTQALEASLRSAQAAEHQARAEAQFAVQKMLENNAATRRSDALAVPD